MGERSERRALLSDKNQRRLAAARRLPVLTRFTIEHVEPGRWHGVLETEKARIEADDTRPSLLIAKLTRRYSRELFLRRPILRPPAPLAEKIKTRKPRAPSPK